MKVKITKSNTSFVKVGEITDLEIRPDGTERLWSNFCQRYESASWCRNVWCVEWEKIDNSL